MIDNKICFDKNTLYFALFILAIIFYTYYIIIHGALYGNKNIDEEKDQENTNPVNMNPVNMNPVNMNPVNMNHMNMNPMNMNPMNMNPRFFPSRNLEITSGYIGRNDRKEFKLIGYVYRKGKSHKKIYPLYGNDYWSYFIVDSESKLPRPVISSLSTMGLSNKELLQSDEVYLQGSKNIYKVFLYDP